ncbi:MAG TPA: glycerol-3-phosphate acyltransferase [Herpetosiphonaceae bacterium]
MVALLSLIAAYVLGAIPCSYLVSRWAGRDLRALGDGNIGAHNVMRHVGRGWGWLALALDVAKGALAVGIALYAAGPGWLPVIAGWLAALGHNYPLWLRFRGGKGLATSFGVVLALFPGLSWLIVVGAALLLILTRNLAFSGVALGLVLAVSAWLWAYPMSYVAAPLGLLLLMAWKQIPDLVRMWRAAPDKRDLILNRWIRDREAKL